jgi:hypothetical protein
MNIIEIDNIIYEFHINILIKKDLIDFIKFSNMLSNVIPYHYYAIQTQVLDLLDYAYITDNNYYYINVGRIILNKYNIPEFDSIKENIQDYIKFKKYKNKNIDIIKILLNIKKIYRNNNINPIKEYYDIFDIIFSS